MKYNLIMTCCPIPRPEVTSMITTKTTVVYELYCDECGKTLAQIEIPSKGVNR